jgi:spermidine synthase
VLPQVLALRTDPPLLGADQAFRTAVDQVRGRLFEFYAAALYAYQGDRESWARSLRRVLQEEGDNPYFRWIIGDSRE